MAAVNDHSALPGFLFRLVGYGLLLLTAFNLVDILLPLQFMNPAWEFQTFGALVESSPIPLLALALVFYGKWKDRQQWEAWILPLLSRLTLVAGVSFLLLIPFGLTSTARMNQQNFSRIEAQSGQQIGQIQQLQTQLNQSTGAQLEGLLEQVVIEGAEPRGQTPQALKSRLMDELTQAEQASRSQAEATQARTRFELFKRSLKWSLGAVVLGFLFIRIWQMTQWARTPRWKSSIAWR